MKIGAIFLLIGVAIGAFLLFSGRSEEAADGVPQVSVTPGPASQSPSQSSAPSAPAAAPATFTVRITAGGLSPQDLEISAGDTVVFVNETDARRWPASDPHPVHTLCPGLDSKGMAPGSEYRHTFAERKTCSFHDHLSPGDGGLKGVITVQ